MEVQGLGYVRFQELLPSVSLGPRAPHQPASPILLGRPRLLQDRDKVQDVGDVRAGASCSSCRPRYLGLQLWADCEAASPTQRVGGHSEFRNWQAGHWLRMKCGCPVIVLKQNHLLCVPPEFSRRAGSLVCCPSSTSACVTADWPRQKPRRGRVRLCSWQPATDAP